MDDLVASSLHCCALSSLHPLGSARHHGTAIVFRRAMQGALF
jgi:hypothetical protein